MSSSRFDVTCIATANVYSARTGHGNPSRARSSLPRAHPQGTASALVLAALLLSAPALVRQAAAADGLPGVTGGTLPLPGPVTGGRGDDGTNGTTAPPADPTGGYAGGAGAIVISAPGPNTSDITGGAGGNGGNGAGTTRGGGGGGAGGSGLLLSGTDPLTNLAVITGGNGGSGGAGSVFFGAGTGGGGGGGVSFSNVGSLINEGTIAGGDGGNGGASSIGSSGGAGGVGVSFSASGSGLTNSGTIRGGNGGSRSGSGSGSVGGGGAGVVGASLTINNTGGTISGGLSGDGVTRANAITFTGGANTLTLANTGGLTGNVAVDGAGTLTFNQATAVTLANAITGSGSIIQDGAGTLALTGSNSYSGGTTITSGTLQIGNGGTTGSISGNVTNNAVLAFNRSDIVTFANAISGTGAVRQIGTGTMILTANNNYSGGTTITSGTLQIGNGGTTGAITGNVTNNAAIVFNRSNTADFNGTMSGTGTVTKQGAGMLGFTGTNTYTGVTTINAGTLAIAGGSAIADTGAVVVNSAGTFGVYGNETIGSLAGTGALFFYGALPTDTTTLTSGGDNASTTFAGVISETNGTGRLTKIGTGTFTLTGNNTYTGATTVDGGTLSVNGSIASSSMTTVNSGGTLGGNGFVGNTTINGGTLAPGNSIGTLTVQGNLVMTSASTYLVEVSPASADRVNVTGTATLGGATVNASFAAGSYIEKQYTILNAQGGVSGKFGGPVNTNLPSNFKSGLSYDAKNAYLDLTLDFTPAPNPNPVPGPNSPSYASLTGNQGNVGRALTDFFNRTGGIPLVFGALDAKGLSQVSGEIAPGSQQTSFDVVNIFMTQMTDPFAAGRGEGAPGATPYADEAMAYAGKRSPTDAFASMHRKAQVAAPQERWNVWAAGFGGSQTTDGNAATGSNNSRSSIYGMAVGADYWFSPFTVAGLSMAGGGTNFSVNGGGSGRSDLFQVGGFIRHNIGSVYVTAAAAYGWQDITTDRTVTVAGLDQLRANFNANSYSGRVEVGNRFVAPWIGGVGLTPYAAFQVTAFELPSYAESVVAGSNTFALTYAGKTTIAPRSELGLRTDKSFAVNDAILTLRGRAAWAHDINRDRSASATFQSLPGASFIVNGAALAKHTALTSTSAELKWMNGWSVAGTFEGEFSEVTKSYAGKGVVRYAW